MLDTGQRTESWQDPEQIILSFFICFGLEGKELKKRFKAEKKDREPRFLWRLVRFFSVVEDGGRGPGGDHLLLVFLRGPAHVRLELV